MILEDLVRVYGTATRLAEAIGCGSSQLCRWRKSGHVPARWRARVDELAKALEAPQDIELDGEAACARAVLDALVASAVAWVMLHRFAFANEAIAQLAQWNVDPSDPIAREHSLAQYAVLRFGDAGNG